MPGFSARRRFALRLALVVAVAISLVAFAGMADALLLAPAGLLALPLLFGRYPGERVLRRLTRRVGSPRAAHVIALPRSPRLLGARMAALATPGCGRAPPLGLSI